MGLSTSYQHLPRSLPEKEGIQSGRILRLLNTFEEEGYELHSMMIAVNGKVITECHNLPYGPEYPHILHSLTKCFTNTAVGIAYSKGLLHLEDRVIDYFPEDIPSDPGENLSQMRIWDLITMRSGQSRGIGGNEWRPLKSSWVKAYFQNPVDCQPGSKYVYSSGNSYILSAIVQKVTGKTAYEYLQEHFIPQVGMRNFTWQKSPEGICSGGNGISMCIEDILKLAQVYLQKGWWEGKSLISEEWVDMALGNKEMVPQRKKDDPPYHFHWTQLGPHTWAVSGMFGQQAIIVPPLQMAIAVTGVTADSSHIPAELASKILVEPTLEEGLNSEEKREQEILRKKSISMSLLHQVASVGEHIDVKPGRYVYQVEDHPDQITQVALEFTKDQLIFSMTDDRGTHFVPCGLDRWVRGASSITGSYLHHQYQPDIVSTVAAAWWSAGDTISMEWRYPEMAFCDFLTLRFSGDQLWVDRRVNVNSQATSRPTVVGKLE